MQIKNKLFPYPTINNSRLDSCYKDTTYSLEYEQVQEDEYLVLKDAHIEINNEARINLIKEGKAKACVIVECSKSVFRKTYNIGLEPEDIKILISDLSDRVVISSFIYATQDIENYRNNDFLEDYEDYNFYIEKYDIIAIDNGSTIVIDYDETSDKKVSSIFLIIKDTETDKKNMRVEIGDKIIAYLPEKQFNMYDNMKKNNNYQNIFFSMLAIPILIEALEKIKNEQYDFDEIELNYRWFRSVKNGFKKKYGYELTEDKFYEIDSAELAQELLNNGTVNAIEDLMKITFGNIMIGGNEYEQD